MKYLIILFFLFNSLEFAQLKTLKGKVVDSQNNPLVGANVIIEKTNIGTATDSKGEFILKAEFKRNQIVKISYLGFKSAIIKVSDIIFSHRLQITLKPYLIPSQTILVEGSIGKAGITPITFTQINKKEIQQNYTDQDIPEYLSYLPSTTFYSENGNGIGYNYLSIRGFDQRRIAVSVNGIPQNDPEDHNVYWLDMPDLLGSTQLIQVQRGAGSGILGYSAIGGSINIITSAFSDKPKFKISSSLGSYNTRKFNIALSSGLVNKKYSFYAKFGNLLSSGYRNNSWVNFKYYFLSAVRYDKNVTTQINLFGGPIADGLAYTGLPKFAIKNKNLRRKNYSYWEANKDKLTYTITRRPDEIENFFQPHFELLNEIKLNNRIKFNSAIFLILGNGFFDYDGSWSIYYPDYFRLKANGFDPAKVPTNALIRAYVGNIQWGWIPRFSWKHKNGELIIGGEFRKHHSKHWGSINFADNLPAGVTKYYRYYYYEGGKDIINLFAHENYKLNERINLLAELQLAYHKYTLDKEKYVGTNFSVSGIYLNPRIGLNYKFTPELSSYFSFARVTREPRLKNYYYAAESSAGKKPQFGLNANGTYNFNDPFVKPETMNDFELGTNYSNKNLSFNLNFYYMLFDNEIVKNGQVDRFGEPITGNMNKTLHTGIEFSSVIKLTNNFRFVFNSTYSKNYISEGGTYIKNPFIKGESIFLDLKGNDISGFPAVLFNAILDFHYHKFYAQLTAKYVGKFYSDNYGSKINEYLSKYPNFINYSDNKVNPYFLTNFFVSYKFSAEPVFNNIKIFAQINNVFDNLYAAYAIGQEFFPAAERNFLFGMKLGL